MNENNFISIMTELQIAIMEINKACHCRKINIFFRIFKKKTDILNPLLYSSWLLKIKSLINIFECD